MTECGAKSILLIGDFNVHHKDWLSSRTTDNAGRRTQQLSDNLGLQQIVKDPTRGENILDLAMTDLPANATTLANIGTSDHNPVLIQLDISASRDKPYKRKVWCYEKANFWDMRGHLSSTDWSTLFKDYDNDPEKTCTKITEVICDAMDAYIPSKTVSRKTGDKVWFDDKCRRLAKRKRRIYRKGKKVSTPENKDKFVQARKAFNQAERNAKRNYSMKLKNDLADRSLSSKKWWGIVNSLSGRTGHSEIPAIEHSGTVHTRAKDKANIFCKTFAEKCRLEDGHHQPQEATVHPRVMLENIVFKPKDITKILRSLKPDKASGPDQVPSRVLKECAAELASPLCRLFRLCFANGTFPDQWKTASVIPVHKRDSKSDPTKYRPISLLSIISKVMESAVSKQLQNHLLTNKLISSRQFGFRPHHSTADLLTILAQTWNASLDRSEEVCIVACDIQGAFDRVWHNGLLAKLRSKGVSGMLLKWLQSYLHGRSIKVVLSGQSSDASPINASVPQGSILGPLLFSVFIDDLVDTCENQLYLFADDSTLFAPIRSVNERASVVASLNRDLEKMRVWAANWKVTFEPTKCKALMLSRKRMPTIPDLYFGSTQLAVERELCILGVTFDSKLLWSRHISDISKKAGQRLGALRKIANKLDTAGRATVYKAQIRSIMEYACLSWMSASPTVLNQLDSIQQKALRIIGVDQVTACRELAITSLQHRREVAAVTVLYKMHTSHCPRDLQALLPNPYTSRRTTRASSSMPDHAVAMPHAKTSTLDRTFLHSAIRIWNTLPDTVVGKIKSDSVQSFKQRVNKHMLFDG